MALLFLNLETTFNVSIRRTDQDVEEFIVTLILSYHQVQSSQTFYSHVWESTAVKLKGLLCQTWWKIFVMQTPSPLPWVAAVHSLTPSSEGLTLKSSLLWCPQKRGQKLPVHPYSEVTASGFKPKRDPGFDLAWQSRSVSWWILSHSIFWWRSL